MANTPAPTGIDPKLNELQKMNELHEDVKPELPSDLENNLVLRKRTRSNPATTSPQPKKSKTDANGSSSVATIIPGSKGLLAERVVMMGIAAVLDSNNIQEGSRLTGMTDTQIRNQLKNGRFNVRKSLLEHARSL